MRSIRRTNHPGMTLVEIMFAFAILTTVLTLAYASAVNAYRSAVSANQRTQAQYIAQQQIEQLRAWRDQPSPVFNWYVASLSTSFISQVSLAGGNFTVRACESPSASCVWEIVRETDPGGDAKAIGSITDDLDTTPYKVMLRATECYVVGQPDQSIPWSDAACSNSANVQGIGVESRVAWQSATSSIAGNDGFLVANTIITQPGIGQ